MAQAGPSNLNKQRKDKKLNEARLKSKKAKKLNEAKILADLEQSALHFVGLV